MYVASEEIDFYRLEYKKDLSSIFIYQLTQ